MIIEGLKNLNGDFITFFLIAVFGSVLFVSGYLMVGGSEINIIGCLVFSNFLVALIAAIRKGLKEGKRE